MGTGVLPIGRGGGGGPGPLPIGRTGGGGNTGGGGGGGSSTPDTLPAPDETPGGVAGGSGLPVGLVPYCFGIGSLAISQTALQLYRVIPHSAFVGKQISVRPPFAGSIVGLGITADAAKSAGTCTFQVFKNAVAVSGASLALGNTTHQEKTFAAGTYSFSQFDQLDVRVTTDASHAPTTLNIEVVLYVLQAAS